jgi:hypothetical protein
MPSSSPCCHWQWGLRTHCLARLCGGGWGGGEGDSMTDLFSLSSLPPVPTFNLQMRFGEIVQGMYLVKCYVLNGE